jgi:hypothetical protein
VRRQEGRHKVDAAVTTPPPSTHALVDWLGDSIVDWSGYPTQVAALVPGLDVRVVAHQGYDPFSYYFLLGRLLDSRPRVVVLMVNLAQLQGGRSVSAPFGLHFLPAAELPHALGLPLHARGLTVARMLLERVRRWPPLDTGSSAAAALVAEAQQRLGTTDQSTADLLVHAARSGPPPAALVPHWDAPFGPRTAAVRMLAAAVAMVHRRGAVPLVIVSPIPRETLSGDAVHDEDAIARRVAALRAVVETRGGRFVDLHRALADADFRDRAAHLSAGGTQRMAALVAPHVSHAVAQSR